MMNKTFLKKECLSLFLLCSLPACIPFKKKKHDPMPPKMESVFNIDIPLQESDEQTIASNEQNQDFMNQDNSRSFIFDEDDFVPKYEQDQDELVLNDTTLIEDQNISWEQDQQVAEFKNIYFNFNECTLNKNQEAALAFNISLAKQKLQEASGNPLVFVIEGHSCHSSGTPSYNLALSEGRAKVLAQKFEEAGIPRTSIKIVGRGQEIPALVDGRPVTGNKEDQWPNRRDEIKVINA